MRRARRLALALLAGLPVLAPAANLGPELLQPLPAVTLAAGASSTPLALSAHLRDPDVTGTAVRVDVRVGANNRVFHLALFDAQTPLTVANFVAYVNSGRYGANFFHRSVPGFVIQNGGFRFIGPQTYELVPAYAAVLNEPGVPNTRGTIAMAKLGGDPNSATSQWFINLADNRANLDSQNGGFTVFGRVLAPGLAVVDEIAAVPRYNASNFNAAWNEIPLTAAFLDRANFIETSASLVAPLAHVAVADDTVLVTPVVNAAGQLQLTAAADRAGATTVRVTSTDLEGATLVSTFSVTVLSSDPYVAWRQTRFATTAATGPAADTADPDADGASNFLEYALGTNPLAASAADGRPLLGRDGEGRLTLTYPRVVDPALTYTVEFATDLAGAWQPLAIAGNPSTGAANFAGPVIITDTVAAGAQPRRFLRLKIAR